MRAILMRNGRAKPYIQTIGEHGIPIRDELDLCRGARAGGGVVGAAPVSSARSSRRCR
jgi:hypothetical protein